MRRSIFVALAAALTSGCMSHNIGAPGTSIYGPDARDAGSGRAMSAAGDMGDMTPEAAMPYAAMAGASDMFEIQSSQIALQKSQRADVRNFAQMLIQHHQMTTQQLMAAAQAAGMSPPPPMLMPMHRRMIAELQAASGSQFDMLFVRQQVPAHEMALALHSNYADNGDTPALQQAARGAVPLVTQHLNMARSMMR
jgi:putative membrane protein